MEPIAETKLRTYSYDENPDDKQPDNETDRNRVKPPISGKEWTDINIRASNRDNEDKTKKTMTEKRKNENKNSKATTMARLTSVCSSDFADS